VQKDCVNCGSAFQILPEDLVMLEKLSPVFNGVRYSIPPPTYCPECREKRRLTLRNERSIYNRKCDKTGKEILSLYSSDKPYTIYDEDVWWGDSWDPQDYGRDFDFSRPFFEQFKELMAVVPRRCMNRTGMNENCSFAALCMGCRNCYMGSTLINSEDVYYSTRVFMSRDCVDCYISGESELLYECIGCGYCYACAFCHDSMNCRNSYLLEDCRNCNNCIACKNLVGKEYHIYNEPVSKGEYEKFLETMRADGYESERDKFNEWKLKFPCGSSQQVESDNATGEYLEGAQNCYHCFEVIHGAQDTRYTQFAGMQCKDLMDCTMAGMNAQLLYEVQGCAEIHNSAFSSYSRGYNLLYCESACNACNNCFGSIGLKKESYLIFNKKYKKEEYEKLVPKIIEHMKKTGEWGEFFPIDMSPFAYNETNAQDLFPMTKDEVEQKGWRWKEEEITIPDVEKVINGSDLPRVIDDVPDDVLNWAITCEATSRPFKIVRQELDFYRKMKLPLPRLHPDERHRLRMPLRNPHRLFNRKCKKCKSEVVTSYAPDRPEIIYCEDCYRAAVYVGQTQSV
jgi:hypothetical protein|tara:strand:+ start:630 stop:2330 length:1701 start_codon:yes stop_codon:yes gene_type:complete